MGSERTQGGPVQGGPEPQSRAGESQPHHVHLTQEGIQAAEGWEPTPSRNALFETGIKWYFFTLGGGLPPLKKKPA